MKFPRAAAGVGLVAVLTIACPLAAADDIGWYGGLNLGRAKAKIDDAKINDNLLGAGFASSSINDNDRDTGGKLYGGYQFNKHFALEGGYFNLGKFAYSATTVPAGTLNGDIKLQGVSLDAVGLLPVTDKFSAIGRLGVTYAQARDDFTGTGSVGVLNAHPSKRDTNYKFGFGLQYAFTDAFAMRIEAERYRINDAVGNKGDIDLISLGLLYRFGGNTPAAAPRATVAEPVAVAGAPPPERPVIAPPALQPAPIPVGVPAPYVAQKVTFSVDSLFDFDKSALKPAGKVQLDQFAADLKGASFDFITVTGHTDRIGPHEYNMKLSTRRAEVVRDYLVGSAGILTDKIAIRGSDGSDPVTKPGECIGEQPTRALIACLQPDRRVDVEVSATR